MSFLSKIFIKASLVFLFVLCFLPLGSVFSKPALAQSCPCGYECYVDPQHGYRCVCKTCPPPDEEGRGGCFLPGTKVLVIDKSGEWRGKNIEKVQIGEKVVSFTVDGKLTSQKVLQKLVHQSSKGYLRISLEDGTVLKVTEEHPFLVKLEDGEGKNLKDNGRWQGYYKTAGELKEGEEVFKLKTSKLEPVKIFKIEKRAYLGKVYNLNIENTHTYFANGVAVHNEKKPPAGCVEGKSCTSNSECPGGVCVYDPYNPACCCDCGGPCFLPETKIAGSTADNR